MAMTVALSKVEGLAARFTGDRQGDELSMTAMVTGVTGAGMKKIENALNATGMPSIGDPPPNSAFTYLSLQERAFQAIQGTTVTFRLIYRGRDMGLDPFGGGGGEPGTVIEMGASVVQKSTNIGLSGDVIEVEYTNDEKKHTQTGTVSVLRPQATINFTRYESSCPLEKAQTHVGTTNSFYWGIAGGMGDRDAWMCMAIIGRSSDLGKTYEVNYSFQHAGAPEGDTSPDWNPYAVYTNADGRPPSDISLTNGMVKAQVYPESNFNSILSW